MADWTARHVEKIATNRTEVVTAANALPETKWGEPSGSDGWTLKDQLAHIGSSHRRIHGVLGAILDGGDPNFAQFARIDEMNEEERQKDKDRAIDDLVASFQTSSAETERLVAQLTDDHEAYNLGPMTLAVALRGFTMHDIAHLEDIKKAALS